MKPETPNNGGPSSYYDFGPESKDWVTWNDMMEHFAATQWKEFSLHMKDLGKAMRRFGLKAGTTRSYDARKIIYSGLRLLIMLEGRDAVVRELERLSADPQFRAKQDTK